MSQEEIRDTVGICRCTVMKDIAHLYLQRDMKVTRKISKVNKQPKGDREKVGPRQDTW